MSDEKNFNGENEEITEVNETVQEEAAEETAEAAETAAAEAEEVPAQDAEPEAESAEEVIEEAAEAAADTETEVEDAQEAVEAAVENAEAAFVAEESAESALGENTSYVESAESGDQNDAEINESAAAAQAVFGTNVKKTNTGAIVAIIVAAVLVIAIVVLGIIYAPALFNKYNRQGYTNVSGRTVGQVAKESGMELDEFLSYYGLPEDMPANTTEAAAYNNIPCENMAASYGMDFATLKELLKFPEEVTSDTPWGEALAQVTVGNYVGDENFDEFKEQYGLGEEVTKDTLWGDVRQTVEAQQKKEFKEQEKAVKEAEKAAAKQDKEEAETTAAPEATAAAAE